MQNSVFQVLQRNLHIIFHIIPHCLILFCLRDPDHARKPEKSQKFMKPICRTPSPITEERFSPIKNYIPFSPEKPSSTKIIRPEPLLSSSIPKKPKQNIFYPLDNSPLVRSEGRLSLYTYAIVIITAVALGLLFAAWGKNKKPLV
jgi:hypothetical protein